MGGAVIPRDVSGLAHDVPRLACEVGQLAAAVAMLAEIHFPERLIATRSADAFMGVLHAALGEATARPF